MSLNKNIKLNWAKPKANKAWQEFRQLAVFRYLRFFWSGKVTKAWAALSIQ